MAFMRALCTLFRAEMGRMRPKVREICEKMLVLRKSAGAVRAGPDFPQRVARQKFKANGLVKSGCVILMARPLAACAARSVTRGGAGRSSESN